MAWCVAIGAAQTPQAPHFAVLIKNGRVLDGSGNPWVRADVGIRDGRIVSIGRLTTATADTVIDADNRFVTPGFIDVHSHAAEGLTRADARTRAQPLLAQGVTTVVVNPDGGGPVDLARSARRSRRAASGRTSRCSSATAACAARSCGTRRSASRPPRSSTRCGPSSGAAMEEGAFGLSSGLFYTPGSFAKTEEVIALATVAGEFGGVYTSHIRDEGELRRRRRRARCRR